MHTREKNAFFLNALQISLSPASREGPFHVIFVRTSMGSESQHATKITSALADSRIYSLMEMMTLSMCIVAKTIFLSVSPSFSRSVVTMSTSKLTGVCMTNMSYQEPTLEDCYRKKKSNTILNLKVKTMNGRVQRTIGVLCWINHIIMPLGRSCWDLWEDGTRQENQQLVSLPSLLPLWTARLRRNMCMEIKYFDSGWMNALPHQKQTSLGKGFDRVNLPV